MSKQSCRERLKNWLHEAEKTLPEPILNKEGIEFLDTDRHLFSMAKNLCKNGTEEECLDWLLKIKEREEELRAKRDRLGPPEAPLTWQEVAERLRCKRTSGEPYTSQRKLAAQIGSSEATVNRAIRETKLLHAWAGKNRKKTASPRAQSLNEVVTDRASQSTELDPADDAAIREFIEKSDPETKAWFLALSTEEQLNFLNDPDMHKRILGRKP